MITGSGSVSGGAVIFIGLFPIVVGEGPDVTLIVLFSIVLTVLNVVVFLAMKRNMHQSRD